MDCLSSDGKPRAHRQQFEMQNEKRENRLRCVMISRSLRCTFSRLGKANRDQCVLSQNIRWQWLEQMVHNMLHTCFHGILNVPEERERQRNGISSCCFAGLQPSNVHDPLLAKFHARRTGHQLNEKREKKRCEEFAQLLFGHLFRCLIAQRANSQTKIQF